MACNASKAPFLRVVAKRGLATGVCPRPLGSAPDVKTTVLGNKMVVAAADSMLPITRVSVIFRAGSRNESYELQGASHMMRVAAGLSTKNSTGFAITRHLQQIGGSLSCTNDREVVAYTVETSTDMMETGLRYLQDAIQPAFKPWELADNVTRIRNMVTSVPPQARAVEFLHRAAFRNGLGNSIYIPKFQIGKLSSESLLHYTNNNCTASRCAVVGVGIDHNTLSGFAQSLEVGSGSGKPDSANYYGGDARHDTPSSMAHVAVAGQGGGLLNQKDALSFAILQHAVGTGPIVKRGTIGGSFGKALAPFTEKAAVKFAVLNASYTDAGLFGFVVSADAHQIGKIVETLTRVLKSGAVSAEDVKRGKALLKAAVLDSYASDKSLITEMGRQALNTQKVHSVDALISAIDGISQQDVQEAAKKAGSSKLSIGAVGNLGHVPYASDLA